MKAQPKRDEAPSLRPVGVALAAVMAGLSAGKAAAVEAPVAPLEPTSHAKTYVVDPTNHPGFEEDSTLVVGPSEPAEPFGAKR